MSRPVTFSVRVGGHGVWSVVEKAVAAEEAGFDQVWTGNDFLGEPGLVTLAAIALRTERIRFGSGVLDPVTLHPGQLATYASGLQEVSGGRFLLGIGAGSEVFFARAGIEPARPAVRTREAVVAVRELLAGRSPAGAAGAGPGWTPQAVLRDPRPTPVYVGGMGPRMLELTGRLADGALPLCLPPRHVHHAVAQIAAGATKAGRSIDDLDVAACVWASISEDRATARRLLARHIALYSGSLAPAALELNGLDPEEFARTQAILDAEGEDAAIDSVSDAMLELGIVGSADEVVAHCAELVESGVRHLSFGPPLGPDPVASIRLLGERVLPVLRAQLG